MPEWKTMIQRWKRPTWKHLFIFLLVLHIAPLWIFTYFPSQDGPSHVYNALTLIEHHKHENYKIREVFKLNLTIFPNWMSHAALALLLLVFPPILTEKVFLTLVVALIPISFFYFLDAVHRRGFLFGWLGFLFAYNYLLFMGFYNFALSISFFFFSLGYWWKHRENLRVNNIIALYILLLVAYLCHIASYGLALLAMSITAIALWGTGAVASAWRERTGGFFRSIVGFLTALKPLIRFVGYMLPAYFILLEYYLESLKDYSGGHHPGAAWIADYFWNVKSLVYFSDWHASVPLLFGVRFNLHRLLLWVLGAAIAASLIYRVRRKQWVRASDAFLLIAVVFTVMFIKAPWGFGPSGWINDRIHLYILLMLAPWLIPDMGQALRTGFTAALVAICLIHFGRSAFDHARLNREIAELTSGVRLMAPHTTYQIRCPDWHKSDALGRVGYVTPFLHAPAFYGLADHDIAHLANYEANYKYFPINFNGEYNGTIDYHIAWGYPESEPFSDLVETYALIHKTRNLKLFRLKQAENADMSLWGQTPDGRRIIRFDMQPRNGETAEGCIEIHTDTRYVSGRFGWATRSPRSDGQGETAACSRDRDFVHDVEDAAFKLDLPNGVYRVTNYFQSTDGAAHEINLLANGQPVIKDLIAPEGDETIERDYTITVTDGHLTQVIYTRKRRIPIPGRHDHWIWNGCVVEQR
jgi:hypothetical protein